ncbi:MAG: tetratricopeptide repeat protein [Deltaproteobacteria bacterium]|nr:tetratricopeptide repeat protein [Deltaproteobacteria bacterium]
MTGKRLALGVMAVWLTLVGAKSSFAQAEDGIPELFESSFAYEATGNMDRALNDVLQVLRKDTGNYIATLRTAWLYYRKARHDESITYYKKASTMRPKAIEPKLGLMLPLMAARQWAVAEKLGEELCLLAPHHYLAGSRLAFIYFSQGKYAKALKQYQQVLDAYPSELEMMLGQGWTYLRMGRKAEAKKMFDQVLRIRRSNLNARSGLEVLAATP